ncbi:MAG: LysR family transcriptional regulator [Burkholderiaceae bacterium]
MLDLSKLNCFVVLAEELHFGRAAARLHISQPPLSLKIRALEEELGLELFARSSRRVALTPSGQLFLQEARRLLRQAEQLVKFAASLESGEAGTLSIGFTAVMAYRIMPSLISAFTAQHPQVRLTLHEMVAADQVLALQEHRLDVGLLRPPLPAGFHTHPLGEEAMLVCLPEQHPLAAQDVITIESLAHEPMIMFSRDEAFYFHNLVMNMCATAGFVPTVRQETRHVHAIVALVSVGMGLAVLPDSATNIHMHGIVFRPLSPNVKAQFTLAVLQGNSNRVAGHFMDVARQAQL